MYKKLFMGTFDSMLVKYGAVMCGYIVVGIPVFSIQNQKYLASVNHDKAQVFCLILDYERLREELLLAYFVGKGPGKGHHQLQRNFRTGWVHLDFDLTWDCHLGSRSWEISAEFIRQCKIRLRKEK